MSRQFPTSRTVLILTGLASLTVGFISGWISQELYEDNLLGPVTRSRQVNLGRHYLLNPLLTCEVGYDRIRQKQLAPIKKKLERLIAERIESGDATGISVYFRQLDDGMTFNINGNEGFEPVSLNKIPIMMGYLKLAEHDPKVLKKKLLYNGKKDWTATQHFKPRETLVSGKSYTVDELINRMIAYSDNNAWKLLIQNIDLNYLDNLLHDLGTDFSHTSTGEPLVTVKSYSIFLQVLYNASYLHDEMSQKAMEHLTAVDFPVGITSSVPLDVVVADKFGEKVSGENGELKQLHDFGIVYYPDSPYIISIMTKGNDFSRLVPILHDISKFVYDDVDRQFKEKSRQGN